MVNQIVDAYFFGSAGVTPGLPICLASFGDSRLKKRTREGPKYMLVTCLNLSGYSSDRMEACSKLCCFLGMETQDLVPVRNRLHMVLRCKKPALD